MEKDVTDKPQWGGRRPNTGGRRPGAGRKPLDPPPRRLHVWVAVSSDAEAAAIKALPPDERRRRLLRA